MVRRLIHDGYPVSAFATPLQSLSGDSSALRDLLASISGPVVLVGHSYGGAVIADAAAGPSQVKALVYLDAFAPAEGEPAIALAGPDSAPNLRGVLNPVPLGAPTPTTELYVGRPRLEDDLFLVRDRHDRHGLSAGRATVDGHPGRRPHQHGAPGHLPMVSQPLAATALIERAARS